MIEIRSILEVADNRPIQQVRCIASRKTSKRKRLKVGDEMLVSVRNIHPNNFWRRGQKVRAVLVRRKKRIRNYSGYLVSFKSNRVVLLNDKSQPIATRIKGPLPFILRNKGYRKMFALGARPI